LARQEQGHAGIVLAWVSDGQLSRVFAAGLGESPKLESETLFEIEAAQAEGMAFLWFLEEGASLAEVPGSEFDALFFDELEFDAKALSRAKDRLGRSSLHYAAAGGLAERGRALLEEGKRLALDRDDSDVTPLRFAIAHRLSSGPKS